MSVLSLEKHCIAVHFVKNLLKADSSRFPGYRGQGHWARIVALSLPLLRIKTVVSRQLLFLISCNLREIFPLQKPSCPHICFQGMPGVLCVTHICCTVKSYYINKQIKYIFGIVSNICLLTRSIACRACPAPVVTTGWLAYIKYTVFCSIIIQYM